MKSSAPLLKENLPGHWFVVANQRTMKVFKSDEQFHMRLIHRLENSGSHGKAKSPHYLESKKHQSREENSLHFAREIVQFLQKEKRDGHFTGITIAAEPRFLGKLKAVLSCDVKANLHSWVHKDLEKTPDHDLSLHFIPEVKNLEFQIGQLAL